MADLKISQLSAATALAGTEVVPVVQSGATKKATIDQILSPASGKGINFAAAGGDILTIYDENSWSPSIKFGGASTGITYSRQAGTYTKIGNVVTVVFDMRLTSKGTATGALTIEGLPFASAGGVNVGFAIAQLYLYSGFVGLTKMGTAYTNGSTVLNEPIDSLSVAITDANFTNSAILFASFTYRAA